MVRLTKNKVNNNLKKLSKIKNHINSDDVIFVKKVPQLRDRRKWLLKKLIKQEYTDDYNVILFLKKIPLHPRNRMQQALKQQAEEVKFVKKIRSILEKEESTN